MGTDRTSPPSRRGAPPGPAQPAHPQPLPPSERRNMIMLTSLMIAVMASVDMTIVSVALPYMAGNLNASPEEITWVVTMFTCGQALIVGVTGHLSRMLGRKRLAIIVVIGFVLSSMACGLAQSMTQIVIFRFLQGIFSGPLIPLSQSMLVDAFPAKDRSKALSIWSMGVLGGPALGPMIGGWLAQNLDWRWNFYVNLPIGIVALFLIVFFVRGVAPQRVRTDLVGLVLLATWVISLQIMLDQGDDLDWFASVDIWFMAVTAATCFIAFLWRGIYMGDANIMRLRLFRDTNFVACSILIAVVGSIFLGILIVTPQLTIDYYRWEVVTSGLVVGGAGLAGIFASLISGRIVGLVGIRVMLLLAALLIALGWLDFSSLNPYAGPMDVLRAVGLVMFGNMLIFPLLAAQSFANIPASDRDEAAGAFNFVKTLGFSFGVTFVSVMIYRGTQANWNRYNGDLSWASPGFDYYASVQGFVHEVPAAIATELSLTLAKQSGILAITQLGEVLAVLALCTIPMALLLKAK